MPDDEERICEAEIDVEVCQWCVSGFCDYCTGWDDYDSCDCGCVPPHVCSQCGARTWSDGGQCLMPCI